MTGQNRPLLHHIIKPLSGGRGPKNLSWIFSSIGESHSSCAASGGSVLKNDATSGRVMRAVSISEMPWLHSRPVSPKKCVRIRRIGISRIPRRRPARKDARPACPVAWNIMSPNTDSGQTAIAGASIRSITVPMSMTSGSSRKISTMGPAKTKEITARMIMTQRPPFKAAKKPFFTRL